MASIGSLVLSHKAHSVHSSLQEPIDTSKRVNSCLLLVTMLDAAQRYTTYSHKALIGEQTSRYLQL